MMLRKIIFISLTVLAFSDCFSQQGLKLWYDHPSAKWTDALPIGNGRLGAMIFGGVSQERIQFNEETLWTGAPRDYNRKGAYKYLAQIRQLLFEGKQKEAEQLAGEQFMGMRSDEGNRDIWFKKVTGRNSLFYSVPNYDDRNWKEIQMPSFDGWEAQGLEGLDGAVWFRTNFTLPESWKGQDLILDLNRIRDQDFSYVNGKLVGSMNNTEPRKYTIPKDVLVPGNNVISIQVLNYFDKGGLAGYKDTSHHIGIYPVSKENEKISLVRKWKYFIQDDAPPPVPHYQADYQPFGDLWLNFANAESFTNYRRELDIIDAAARTSYTLNGVDFVREFFASAPDQAIVIRLSSNQPKSISFECVLNSPHKHS